MTFFKALRGLKERLAGVPFHDGQVYLTTDDEQLYVDTVKSNGSAARIRLTNKERTLTQVEYEALTPEEKNNGTTYYIIDGSATAEGSGTFTIMLLQSGWVEGAQTVQSSHFIVDGFNYIPSPRSADREAYTNAKIYGDDVTIDGQMTFHCGDAAPETDIVVEITRLAVQQLSPPFDNPITGNITLGNTVTFDNKSWQIQHIDGNFVYLALSTIVSQSTFGTSNVYAGSLLADAAASYQSNNMSVTALDYCQNVTVNGITSKVFAPSYEQLSDTWAWSKAAAANRVCQYDNVNAEWWTSSPYDSTDASYVSSTGEFNHGSAPNYAYGFRPAVKVQFK